MLSAQDGVLGFAPTIGGSLPAFAVPVGEAPGDAFELVHVHSELPVTLGTGDPVWECVLVLDSTGTTITQLGRRYPGLDALSEGLDAPAVRTFATAAGLGFRYERGHAATLRATYPGAHFPRLRGWEAGATSFGLILVAMGGAMMSLLIGGVSGLTVALAILGLLTVFAGVFTLPATARRLARAFHGRSAPQR